MQVARSIQQTLLPRELPALRGWQMANFYQPARYVGGDFYDFIYFPDGRLGIVIGDVSGKGVPAALVMATTRSLIRFAAHRLISPGKVLHRVNNLLDPDIPPNMFVTCQFALLDPSSGQILFANAGHNLPFLHCSDQSTELRATGMPLGLMPDSEYEERETTLDAGDYMLFYSDGLSEAHNPKQEMYGRERLQAVIEKTHGDGTGLISNLLSELNAFTGPNWEQEDDITLLAIQRQQ